MRRRRSVWNHDAYDVSTDAPTNPYEAHEDAAWDDELEDGDGRDEQHEDEKEEEEDW